MDTRTNPSIETLQGPGDAGQQFEPTAPTLSMPGTTAFIGSPALVCSAAVPLVVLLSEQAFADELGQLVSHLADRLSGDGVGSGKVFRDTAVTNEASSNDGLNHSSV